MTSVRKDFDSYQLWYYTGHPYEVLIYCYLGSSYAGRIVFYKDDTSTPQSANHSNGPSIHYPLSRFNDIMSILHHEKPLYLFLNLDNHIGILATAEREPVGEEEAKAA